MRQKCYLTLATGRVWLISYWLPWLRLTHMGSDVGQIVPTVSLHRDHSILYALVCENKSILHMYCCGTRKSHPRTGIIRQKRGSTRLCRVSDEIIQVRGWDFLVPQQYIMMDTFSRPVCEILRFYRFCIIF